MKNSTKRQLFPYWREVNSIYDLPKDEQNEQGIKRLTEQWQGESFNHIDIDTFNADLETNGESIHENIEPLDIMDDFISYDCNNINELTTEYKEENEITGELHEIKEDEEFMEWLELTDEFISYKEDRGQENYPMWNTLFEWKEKSTEEWNELAMKAGFGLINECGNFNDTLFVAGAGYSFYGQHWIPLFLSLPYNKKLRKECQELGLKYSHL